jgi:hypothetical protein
MTVFSRRSSKAGVGMGASSERSAASQSKPRARQTSASNYHPGRRKGHRHATEAHATQAYENETHKNEAFLD